MTRRSRSPAWSTLAAAGLMAVVTAGFAVFAVEGIAGLDPDRVAASRDATLLGLDAAAERTVTQVTSVVILVVSALTATQCVGLLRRREGARHAALLTFTVLGLIALATAVPGVLADPRAPRAWYGVLTGVADAAIVLLLLLPATADDVEWAERARHRPVPRM